MFAALLELDVQTIRKLSFAQLLASGMMVCDGVGPARPVRTAARMHSGSGTAPVMSARKRAAGNARGCMHL
jgi:hypothetical protein